MADLAYIVIIVAFFALMVAFVHMCERIIGKDDATGSGVASDELTTDTHSIVPEEVPA